MSLYVHELKGCSPEPLAFYLKALGVLRLLAEQHADDGARGWWQGEHFWLLSKLSREQIETFFLEAYEPTPLLSPWNKGSGFFKVEDPGLFPLEKSHAPRLAPFRQGIHDTRRLLDDVQQADAVIRAIKACTKTNRTFQSDQQRRLLEESSIFRGYLAQQRTQADGASVSPLTRQQALADIRTAESLVVADRKSPTRSEAEELKADPAYKRLLALADRRFKFLKAALIPSCRNAWRGPHAEWLSAAVVVDEDGTPIWPSLLGTGGNDGNLDFTNNFMQRIGELFELVSSDAKPTGAAKGLLANSLWGDPSDALETSAVGQFEPGAAGGANSSTGSGGESLVNAWDFVLMMEGTLLFSARVTKRLDPNELARASAPFAVRSHAAGFASAGLEKAQRGEQWLPLWSQPAAIGDVAALFCEGRIQVDRHTANRPVDAARAISRLGVARGVDSFARYGYLERNGQSTLAVPLGRIRVQQHPLAYLIDDIAGWIARLQRRAADKNSPSRLVHAERQLTDAVLAALTHDYSERHWQAVLIAAAGIESIQATGTAIDAGPIPPLRPEWASAAGNSPEVRLAISLGSAAAAYGRTGHPIDHVRSHCLPLDRGRFRTSEKRLAKDPRIVMFGRDALADLAALVERRLVEAERKGQRRLPLVAPRGCGATMGDLEAFVCGAVDADKVLRLARAFMAIDWRRWSPRRYPGGRRSDRRPDDVWLALRLACLPWPFKHDHDIPAEPNMIRRLRAGDGAGASAIAIARLRASGVRPPLQAGVCDAATARRWAAAIAFPIDRGVAQDAAETLDPAMKGLTRV